MRQKPKVLTCKKPISQQLCDLYNLYLITIYLKNICKVNLITIQDGLFSLLALGDLCHYPDIANT